MTHEMRSSVYIHNSLDALLLSFIHIKALTTDTFKNNILYDNVIS